MSINHIGLDYAKVNPNGGAIALGHVRPLCINGFSNPDRILQTCLDLASGCDWRSPGGHCLRSRETYEYKNLHRFVSIFSLCHLNMPLFVVFLRRMCTICFLRYVLLRLLCSHSSCCQVADLVWAWPLLSSMSSKNKWTKNYLCLIRCLCYEWNHGFCCDLWAVPQAWIAKVGDDNQGSLAIEKTERWSLWDVN